MSLRIELTANETIPTVSPDIGRFAGRILPIKRGLIGNFLTVSSAAQARYNNVTNDDADILGEPRYEPSFVAGADSTGQANEAAINTGLAQTSSFTWIAIVKSLDTGDSASTRPQWVGNRLSGANSDGARIQEGSGRSVQAVLTTASGSRNATLVTADPTVWQCVAFRVQDGETFELHSVEMNGAAAEFAETASANVTGLASEIADTPIHLLDNANTPGNAGMGAGVEFALHNVLLTEEETLAQAAMMIKTAAALGSMLGT